MLEFQRPHIDRLCSACSFICLLSKLVGFKFTLQFTICKLFCTIEIISNQFLLKAAMGCKDILFYFIFTRVMIAKIIFPLLLVAAQVSFFLKQSPVKNIGSFAVHLKFSFTLAKVCEADSYSASCLIFLLHNFLLWVLFQIKNQICNTQPILNTI